jgi:di/tricarboxylate transporter
MRSDQILLLLILLATTGLFLWGRWRHDMVAVAALLACVPTGLVAPAEAFAGFGHPAVITVACVLVLSRALQTSGAVDVLARRLLPAGAGTAVSLLALVGLGALLSGFMNNVGAMALLMPVAIRLARRLDLAPGQVLMPLAFGTILGGMTTLIGTPPNLIVSAFRAQAGAGSFGMFDFAPVGLAVAVAGVAFVALLGWRLVPARRQSGIEGFESGAYLTEARVPEGGKAVGKSLRELEQALEETGAQIVGLVRQEMRVTAPNPRRRLRAGDILVIEAEADALASMLSTLGLKLEEARPPPKDEDSPPAEAEGETDARTSSTTEAGDAGTREAASAVAVVARVSAAAPAGKPGLDDVHASTADEAKSATGDAAAGGEPTGGDGKAESSGEVVLMELAVLPGSPLTSRSANDIALSARYGLNLLALSRQGERSMVRLRSMKLLPGDLLLMQGPPEAIAEFAADSSCVPLAERELRIPSPRKAWQSVVVMALAVAGAAFGLLPAAVSFALGVLASMVLRTMPARGVYEAVDWPVVVLLAALIPVAGAMESSGTADLVARLMLEHVAQGQAVVGLALILVVTMFLSDLMNNAATAAVMCPIALGTAAALGVNPDTFLMAVAIGASCAFLTPIGHQNNTLILGPGGFRFGDYWRMGLPLELLVVAISLPLLLLVWPL